MYVNLHISTHSHTTVALPVVVASQVGVGPVPSALGAGDVPGLEVNPVTQPTAVTLWPMMMMICRLGNF